MDDSEKSTSSAPFQKKKGVEEELKWLKSLLPHVKNNEISEIFVFSIVRKYQKLLKFIDLQENNRLVLLSAVKNFRDELALLSHTSDRFNRNKHNQRFVDEKNDENQGVEGDFKTLYSQNERLDAQISHLDRIKERKVEEIRKLRDDNKIILEEKIKNFRTKSFVLQESIVGKEKEFSNLTKACIKIEKEISFISKDSCDKNGKIKKIDRNIKELERKPAELTFKNKCFENKMVGDKEKLKLFQRKRELLIHKKIKLVNLQKELTEKKALIENKHKSCLASIGEENEEINAIRNSIEVYKRGFNRILFQIKVNKSSGLKKKIANEGLLKVAKSLRKERNKLKESIDNNLKRIKVMEEKILVLDRKKNGILHKKNEIFNIFKKTKGELKDIDDEVAILMRNYLVDNENDEGLTKVLKKSIVEIKYLSKKVNNLFVEDRMNLEKLQKLNLKRDLLEKEIVLKKNKFVDMISHIKTITFEHVEFENEINELKKSFLKVKFQNKVMEELKNKYLNSTASYEHEIRIFTKERQILRDEYEVLLRMGLEKEKNLLKNRALLDQLIGKNEKKKQLQSKYENMLESLRDDSESKRSMIAEKLIEIKGNEKEIMKKRKEFELVNEGKRLTGVELTRKNDELTVLYEKSDHNAKYLIEMKEKLEKIRVIENELKNNVRNLQNLLKIEIRKVPKLKELEVKRKSLVMELNILRKKLQEMVDKASNPNSLLKIREIKGRAEVEDKNVMKEKIKDLKKKIFFRSEQIMEKNLILMELTKTSDALRKVTVNYRNTHVYKGTMGLSDLYSKIRKQNSVMKSLLSEISIYEANLLHLKEKNSSMSKIISNLNEELKKKTIPEEILLKYQQRKDVIARIHEKRALNNQNMEKNNNPNYVKTTANPRPNSYIPNVECNKVLHIPIPYMFKPIFPSKLGMNVQKNEEENRKINIIL